MKSTFRAFAFLVAAFALDTISSGCLAQETIDTTSVGAGNWLTFAANLQQAGYERTDFFYPHYSIAVAEWDSRAELWLPPFRDRFSWGPYLKLAGVAQSKTVAFPNAWLGGPGLGFQIYPFSSTRFQSSGSTLGKLFGPLRMFAEYNRTSYWGPVNRWRPRAQTKAGFEYWRAINVNEPGRAWWLEIWNGLYWQSSNEFTDRYDSIVFGNSWRAGMRKPHAGFFSTITPYLAVESARSKYDYAGTAHCFFTPQNGVVNPCDFYWENRLLVGGGLRFAPSLLKFPGNGRLWLNRFVLYGEYVTTATYYGPAAPSSTPRFDLRAGLGASVGQWYH